ncbi:MAG: M57 family metalloprotease [Kofleriaceae bacterium]
MHSIRPRHRGIANSLSLTLACLMLSGAAACVDEAPPRPGELEIMPWEDFLKMSTKSFEGQEIFVLDGDIAVAKEEVRPYYDKLVANIKAHNQALRDGLTTEVFESTVNTVGGVDDVWSPSQRRNLTYCVSDEFGADKTLIQNAMAGATADLEAFGHFDFRYISAHDANCNNTNTNVLFSVRPWTSGGACAFFPSGGGCVARTVVINVGDFGGTVTHRGVLRHELGHTLGLRHEHIRYPGTFCAEGGTWRAVTSYDSQSMMHYPSCPGATNTGDLAVTRRDGQGIASLYAATLPGHEFFTANFTNGSPGGASTCTAWNDFRSRLDGNFTSVVMSGSADGDGIACNDPEIATQICNAMETGTPLGITCGGNTWNVGECGGTAVAVNSGVCACPASGAHIARPCIGNSNWGGMGTATCGGPTQSLEVRCMRGTEKVYESNFNQGIAPAPQQCTDWNNFRSSVSTGADFVRLSGSADPEGVMCGNPAAASQICNALRTGGTLTGLTCGANTWNVGACGGTAVSVNSSVCSCPTSDAHIARPCITNQNWGGMLTSTCNGPSQSLRVSCGTAPEMFSDYLAAGSAPAGVCTAWNNFRSSLTGTYSKVTLRGSADPDGVTCSGTNANTICQALRTGTPISSLTCDGNTWNVGACGGTAVSVNSSVCSCPASGAHIARPCIGNSNWGGMGTATCGSPGQSMDVICE